MTTARIWKDFKEVLVVLGMAVVMVIILAVFVVFMFVAIDLAKELYYTLGTGNRPKPTARELSLEQTVRELQAIIETLRLASE